MSDIARIEIDNIGSEKVTLQTTILKDGVRVVVNYNADETYPRKVTIYVGEEEKYRDETGDEMIERKVTTITLEDYESMVRRLWDICRNAKNTDSPQGIAIRMIEMANALVQRG